MLERVASGRRWRPALTATILLIAIVLLAHRSPAHSLTRDEHNELLKSIQPSELAHVEAATGGVDKLPLVRLDVHLDLEAHSVSGKARVEWRNVVGHPVSVLPIRLASNSDNPDGPTVTWTHLRVTMPGKAPVAVHAKHLNAAIQEVPLPAPLPHDAWVTIEGDLNGQMVVLAAGATDPVQASLSAINGGHTKATADQYGTFACGEGICTLTGFAPEVPAFINADFDTKLGSGIGDWPYSDPENVILDVSGGPGVKVAATGLNLGSAASSRTRFVMAATREIGIVASANFVTETAEVDGVHITSLALEDDKESGQKVLKAAKESIATFDRAFGHYPWTFLNVSESALIGGAGGDELPGLTLNGSAFYHSGGGSSLGAGLNADSLKSLGLNLDSLQGLGGAGLFGSMLDFITRHEVAHQWWYAVVGSDPQEYPYIDEPLAQWSALYSVRENEGEEAAKSDRDLQIAMNFQALGMLGTSDGEVARPAGAFDSPVEYAGLVYGKAPLFFEAAAKKFGTKKVLAGLRMFVQREAFQRSDPDDELRALEYGIGRAQVPALHQLWHRWFHEKHGSEDVGGLDMAGLASQMGVSSDLLDQAGGQLDPQTMKDSEKTLKELMKDLGEGSDTGSENVDPKALQELMKSLGVTPPAGNDNGDQPSSDE